MIPGARLTQSDCLQIITLSSTGSHSLRSFRFSGQSSDKKDSRRLLMGSVVIQCPATGHTISTGIEADRLKFSCSPVFFADAYCPHCNANHRWFARDAWVEDPKAVAEAA